MLLFLEQWSGREDRPKGVNKGDRQQRDLISPSVRITISKQWEQIVRGSLNLYAMRAAWKIYQQPSKQPTGGDHSIDDASTLRN
jgi:hypothetical protein